MQQPFLTAKDQVFASGDLVYLLKDCFTKNTFALNKKFVRFAKKNQIDIKPVSVRANVDLPAYREASHAIFMPFKICDLEWPTHTDPTAEFDLMDFLLQQYDPLKFQAAVHRIAVLKTMTSMMDAHAPHIRHLHVHMSLNVSLEYPYANASLYEHINRFFTVLEKCTAIEKLTIVQTDYAAKDAKLTTVQCRLFRIINTMQNLKVLDFNGNMTIEGDGITHDGSLDTHHTNQLTLCDYLPASLRELTIRDGPVCRMLKWREFYGFSAGLKLLMNNFENRVPSLKSISLPSSFWSLPAHVFGGFVRYLNSNHITHIGFSDEFKLKTGPTKPRLGTIMPLPAPCLMLHHLLATLAIDMVVDIRGGGHVERAERIEWAMDSLQSNSLLSAPTTSDGATYTTVTIRKKNNATVRVLI